MRRREEGLRQHGEFGRRRLPQREEQRRAPAARASTRRSRAPRGPDDRRTAPASDERRAESSRGQRQFRRRGPSRRDRANAAVMTAKPSQAPPGRDRQRARPSDGRQGRGAAQRGIARASAAASMESRRTWPRSLSSHVGVDALGDISPVSVRRLEDRDRASAPRHRPPAPSSDRRRPDGDGGCGISPA